VQVGVGLPQGGVGYRGSGLLCAGRHREQDIGLVYWQVGRKGLESIDNVEPRLAALTAEHIVSAAASPSSR